MKISNVTLLCHLKMFYELLSFAFKIFYKEVTEKQVIVV